MPKNGEQKQKFGVYRSHCCSAEIFIRESASFPHCPNHPRLATIWQPLDRHRARRTRRDRSLIRPLSPSIKKVNPQWHVLQVRQRFERIVALRLRERAIEACVPLRQIDRKANATYSIELPLFPGYVFCKYDEVAVSSFLDIPGVRSTVQGDHGINIVPEQQITDLQRILAAGLGVQAWPFVLQGRTVMVEDGPLSGVTGILEQRADKRLLVLPIELIRRSIAVKIEPLSRISFRSGAAFPFGIAHITS